MIERLATRIGATEGQLWTFGVALLVVLLATITGLPGVGDHDERADAAAAPSPELDSAPTTVKPLAPPRAPALAVGSQVRPPSPLTVTSGRSPSPPSRAEPDATGAPSPERGTASAFAAGAGDEITAVATTIEGDVRAAFATDGAGRVDRFSPAGALLSSTDVDVVVLGLAVDDDRTVVAAADPARVATLDLATGELSTLAELPDVLPCYLSLDGGPCEPGVADAAPVPSAVLAHPTAGLLVADAGQGAIWSIADGTAVLWSADENMEGLPGDGLAALALADGGDVVATVGARVSVDGGGAIVRFEVTDGKATTTQVIAATDSDDPPGGVAVGTSGTIYVALPATDRIVVFQGEGAEPSNLPSSGEELAAPRHLAFLDAALLASSLPSTGPGLVRVQVGEQGVMP